MIPMYAMMGEDEAVEVANCLFKWCVFDFPLTLILGSFVLYYY